MSVTVRPLSHALGAEIAGVDLARPLSNAEFDQIHRTFLDKRHPAVPRPEDHARAAHRLQPPLRRARHPRIAAARPPSRLSRAAAGHQHPQGERQAVGLQVHRPAMAFRHVVHAGAVAGLAAARHHHPAGRRRHDVHQHVPGLRHAVGRHEEDDRGPARHPYRQRKIVDLSSDRAVEQRKLNPPIAQPVVRVHPETGRKALYIGEKVSCFVGMTAGGEPAADRLSRQARHAAAVRLSPSVARRTTSCCGTTAAPCTSRWATTRKARSATSSARP